MRASVFVLGAVMAAIPASGFADPPSEPYPPVALSGVLLTPANARQCLLSVTNRLGQGQLEKLRVTLLDSRRGRAQFGPADLKAGQSIVLVADVTAHVDCAGPGITYRVSYLQGGVTNEILIPSPAQAGSALLSLAGLNSLVGPVFGLFSGLLGGWLGSRWTTGIERMKDRLAKTKQLADETRARNRADYDKCEPEYRRFLMEWNQSTIPDTLQTRFNDLQGRVRVDTQTSLAYRRTYAVLAGTGRSADEKQVAAQDLEKTMRSFLDRLRSAG